MSGQKVIVLVLAMLSWEKSTAVAGAADTSAARRKHVEFELSLGATQAQSSENWEGGEYAFLAWISDLRFKMENPIVKNWESSTELKVSFGQEHQHMEGTESWAVPKRTADRLREDYLLRYTHGWAVDPYFAVTAESQFSDEAKRKRRHFNPIDLTESAGVAHYLVNHPSKAVLLTRAGLGIRQHFHIAEDPYDPAITHYESNKDGGAEWVTTAELGSPAGRYSFVSRLTFFQAIYSSLPSGDDEWKEIDIGWDNTLRLYATRFLQTSLNWQLVYDKQASARGRYMEMLTLSLAYRYSS